MLPCASTKYSPMLLTGNVEGVNGTVQPTRCKIPDPCVEMHLVPCQLHTSAAFVMAPVQARAQGVPHACVDFGHLYMLTGHSSGCQRLRYGYSTLSLDDQTCNNICLSVVRCRRSTSRR
jgi:hypothetical protein